MTMSENSLINKLELHYYFDENDETHSMDAFVRNRCEYELLQIHNELQKELELNIKVETEAFEEGGLTELWTFLSDNTIQLTIILIAVAQVLSRIPLGKSRLERTNLNLSIEERRLNIELLKKNLKEKEIPSVNIETINLIIDYNPKIIKHISNFYKQLYNYPKVKKISTTKLTENKQQIEKPIFVFRNDFEKFILDSDELESVIDDSATIEIISPVLKKGKYKWKGLYNKAQGAIDFFMKDKIFKGTVVAEGIAFKNGTFIDCVLEISRKINELGEIYNSSYSVMTVLKKHDENVSIETPQGRKYRQEKDAERRQLKLFDNKNIDKPSA